MARTRRQVHEGASWVRSKRHPAGRPHKVSRGTTAVAQEELTKGKPGKRGEIRGKEGEAQKTNHHHGVDHSREQRAGELVVFGEHGWESEGLPPEGLDKKGSPG